MTAQLGKDMSRSMTDEQFCQIMDAILNGKYSWACLLILKFAGYNPRQYLPSRTYTRLMRENSHQTWRNHRQTLDIKKQTSLDVDDLPYLTPLGKATANITGGRGENPVWSLCRFFNALENWN